MMNRKKAHRLWKKAGLQVPVRRRRRRGTRRDPMTLPTTRPNQVWAYDFVFDTCMNGQRIKCLTVIDEWSRECLTIDVAGAFELSVSFERCPDSSKNEAHQHS